MIHVQTLPIGNRLADLCVVPGAAGLVLFCHADGASRTSARSRHVARRLQHRGLSTLLFDLLDPDEAARPSSADDIDLLTQRVLQAIDALPAAQRDVPIGLFGSDTGSAAALVADTRLPAGAAAVVSRSGRLDGAGRALAEVRAPTLLIVGGADPDAVEGNRRAYALLRCEKRIEIVPRTSHHFVEAGALDRAALSAGDWFCEHLRRPG
jgi:pimeloyl-ACP methyl ester carboxylesterase